MSEFPNSSKIKWKNNEHIRLNFYIFLESLIFMDCTDLDEMIFMEDTLSEDEIKSREKRIYDRFYKEGVSI